MIGSFFRWIGIVFIMGYYCVAGLVRAPFGKAGPYFWRITGNFGRKMLFVSGSKATWEGLDRLDPNKHYVFVGNHQSYADIFLVFASLASRNMSTLFMVKKELFKLPLFGPMTKQMQLIPIEREESRKALKTVLDAVKIMKEGHSLTIFAEGSRTKDGEIQPFKRGAFLIAEHTGLPIVPFAITGTAAIMPRGNMSVNPGSCHISFLPPIMPGDMPSRELAVTVENIVRQEYDRLRLAGEAGQRERDKR